MVNYYTQNGSNVVDDQGNIIAHDDSAYLEWLAVGNDLASNVRNKYLMQMSTFYQDTLQAMLGNPTISAEFDFDFILPLAQSILNNTPLSSFQTAYMSMRQSLSTQDAQKEWATGIIEKADKYGAIYGIADEIKQSTINALNAAQSPSDLNTVWQNAILAAQAAIAKLCS